MRCTWAGLEGRQTPAAPRASRSAKVPAKFRLHLCSLRVCMVISMATDRRKNCTSRNLFRHCQQSPKGDDASGLWGLWWLTQGCEGHPLLSSFTSTIHTISVLYICLESGRKVHLQDGVQAAVGPAQRRRRPKAVAPVAAAAVAPVAEAAAARSGCRARWKAAGAR